MQNALVANGIPSICVTAELNLVVRVLSSVVLHRNALAAIEEVKSRHECAVRVVKPYVELGFRESRSCENQAQLRLPRRLRAVSDITEGSPQRWRSAHCVDLMPQLVDRGERPSTCDEEVTRLRERHRVPRRTGLTPCPDRVLNAKPANHAHGPIARLQAMPGDAARSGLARGTMRSHVHFVGKERGYGGSDEAERCAMRKELVLRHPRSERDAGIEETVAIWIF